MNLLSNSFFRKYLLPGFVFQSVIIGGGYGTGRELVEYFLNFGPVGGVLGMLLVTMVIWSVFLGLTFEFTRRFRAFDYRTFFKKLLGPFWPAFDILYLLYLIIVLAVLGSASGVLIRDNFGIPYMVGVILMLAAVGFLTFRGAGLMEKFFSIWSFILYAVYATLLVFTIVRFGPAIKQNFSVVSVEPGWIVAGSKYAFYNLANVVGVLFCLKHIQTRKEAFYAGAISGVIGIVPALLFYIALVAHYPAILSEEIPSVFAFEKLGFLPLFILFQIVLYGTLIETGTAMIHAVNERIQSARFSREKELPRVFRPVIAIVLLALAIVLSTFGIIALIARGYGAISWGFLVVYLVPLGTIGMFRIVKG
jgi:uncharacterized membrane protein YkvI